MSVASAALATSTPELSVHDRPPGETPRAWLLGAMLALYLCVQTPNAASLTRFVNDERFYSDAALHMLSSGEFLTLFYGHGERQLDEYAQALWQGTGAAYLARHRQAVFLAVRIDPHGR